MDLETFGDGTATTNGVKHTRNPQRAVFLQAKMVGDTNSPGVGLDGVFRDPWGNPYIISFDLDNDGSTVDGYYGKLIDQFDSPANRADPKLAARYIRQKDLVWSFGPDGKVEALPVSNPAPPANTDVKNGIRLGENKDNILSWMP